MKVLADRMIVKTWALAQDSFNDADIAWCRGLGVAYKIEPNFNQVYAQGRLVDEVIRSWSIRLETTDQKQETMLKLKYGSNLHRVLHRNINSKK